MAIRTTRLSRAIFSAFSIFSSRSSRKKGFRAERRAAFWSSWAEYSDLDKPGVDVGKASAPQHPQQGPKVGGVHVPAGAGLLRRGSRGLLHRDELHVLGLRRRGGRGLRGGFSREGPGDGGDLTHGFRVT